MKQLISAAIAALVGAALYGYFRPTKSQTEVKTVTQVVEHTVTRIVRQKDGTTVTVVDSTRTKDQTKQKDKNTLVAKNWHAGLVLSQDTTHITMFKPAYGLMVERRILGPMFVGAYVTPGQSAGLLVTVEF